MRITGGKARGIRLNTPEGRVTRPATDQMREAVFSSLGAAVEGARIADLFAGTGAYGLEAMSRGASQGLFVESSRDAVACLRKNIEAVAKSCRQKPITRWKILAQKIYTVQQSEGPFDLIFMDPPYAIIENKIETVFRETIEPLCTQKTLICLEMPGDLEISFSGWSCIKRLGKKGKDKPSAALFKRA